MTIVLVHVEKYSNCISLRHVSNVDKSTCCRNEPYQCIRRTWDWWMMPYYLSVKARFTLDWLVKPDVLKFLVTRTVNASVVVFYHRLEILQYLHI